MGEPRAARVRLVLQHFIPRNGGALHQGPASI
jgi:hypothetical protein